jgi:SET domain-containing protein
MCYAFELPLSEDSNLRPAGRENKVVVDPTRFGGLARYVNHSCLPNLDFIMVRAGKDLPVQNIRVSLAIFFLRCFCRCILREGA